MTKAFPLGRVLVPLALFFAAASAIRLLPESHQPAALWLLAGGFAVYAAIRAPAVLIFGLTAMTMRVGGVLLLVTPPLAVLLASRATRLHHQGPKNRGRATRAWVGAAVALLLALLFAPLSAGPTSDDRTTSPASAQPLYGEPDDPSAFDRLVQAIRDFFGRGGTATAPGSGSVPPDEDDDFPWLWVLAMVAAALAVAVLVWWLWKRRRRQPARPEAAWSLARLESIGRRVGRRRQPSEGAIAYAEAVAHHTGDPRLTEVGPVVSGQVYASPSTDAAAVDGTLGAVEADPPNRPPRRLLRRGWTGAVRVARTPRAWGVVGIAVAATIWIVQSADIGFAELDDPLGTPAQREEMPPEWEEIWASAGGVDRWEVCSYRPEWEEVHRQTIAHARGDGVVAEISEFEIEGESDRVDQLWTDDVWVLRSADYWSDGPGWSPSRDLLTADELLDAALELTSAPLRSRAVVGTTLERLFAGGPPSGSEPFGTFQLGLNMFSGDWRIMTRSVDGTPTELVFEVDGDNAHVVHWTRVEPTGRPELPACSLDASLERIDHLPDE